MSTAKTDPKWLDWARQIQSLAQTGLTFASNDYEVERNTKLIELASRITAELTDQDFEGLNKVLMEQPGYATPKVDVRAAVVKDGEILLVQEAADNKWAMPGGWADVGDTPRRLL